jgi:hypothetical protein
VPVAIGEMDVDLDLADEPQPGGRGIGRISERELLDRLRPLLLEIVRQEIERLRREHGR